MSPASIRLRGSSSITRHSSLATRHYLSLTIDIAMLVDCVVHFTEPT
jgi:hypothetical protein